ncbi:hypothetical protein MPTK1_8g01220 [Marchantia polymorpha subsp. ruderalis]|nr:hypothetical protein MARPO_0064s0076 [Marchantia polymorpha]BBN18275.1 hypothetical protein Mp_8g01220 [Marchantia polymorpha subsp. ruderalis]|eukprot:PTQ36397.1 hypothetical protein MARPO_0064s0076 [Marchantia polymorpha]
MAASSDSTRVVGPRASGKMPSAEFGSQVAGVEGKRDDRQPGLTRTVTFVSSALEGVYVQDEVLKVDEKSRMAVTSELEGGHLALGLAKVSEILTAEPVAYANTKTKTNREVVLEDELKQAHEDAHLQKTEQMLTALSRLMEEYVINSSSRGAAVPAVQD